MYQADPVDDRQPGVISDPLAVMVQGENGLLRRRIIATLTAAGIALHDDGAVNGSGEVDVDVVVLVRDLSNVTRLLDLRMDVQQSGTAPTVIVSPEAHGPALRRALSAGASGLVLDTEIDAALVASVRAVAANQTCVPRALKIAVDKPTLSHREREVLKLAVSGLTNGEIAAALCLAESTVKSHLVGRVPSPRRALAPRSGNAGARSRGRPDVDRAGNRHGPTRPRELRASSDHQRMTVSPARARAARFSGGRSDRPRAAHPPGQRRP